MTITSILAAAAPIRYRTVDTLVIERRRTQSVELELFPAVPAVRERRIAM